jgi:hypothetical protein
MIAHLLLMAFYFIAWMLALLWVVSHFERVLQRSRKLASLVFGLMVGISFFAAYSLTYHPASIEAPCFDRQGSYTCD